ncbi:MULTISPECIES: OmpA family protein [unclassified Bacteroides]|uniref:OmpA family protein n=1 Tax=unclassified Bacteroides TaxID=2646097 RepID=UPI004064A6BF
MNKERTKPLIPPLSGRWARVGLTILLTATVAVGAQAQTAGEDGTQPPQDRNSDLRTRTWSIYAQGGLSWATDVWYQNLDAKRSYRQSPAVGGGVDFTIRPWVRVGAEYIWSRYRREQRFPQPDTRAIPVKAYGNYLMNFHNVRLGVGLNLMELWPDRRAQWLNIWTGTGMGYTFAKGNEYGMYFSNTKTAGGQTTPFADGESISNDGSITVMGNVRTTNRHEKFNTFYVPASLHIEADVSRQFTVGLKGEMDWLFNRKDIAPKNLIFALATVRYNFVPGRAKMQRAYYEGEISTLNDRINALRQEAEAEKARAGREAVDKARLQEQNADLERRLQDCENSKPTTAAAVVQTSHFVQFAHNSSYMSREEAHRLETFARSVKGQKLALVAEASTPGTTGYNQTLSERRLTRVVEALVKEGFALEDLHPTAAIGERNGKPRAEGRRVTITVEP